VPGLGDAGDRLFGTRISAAHRLADQGSTDGSTS
jgi:hypothetical protein